MDGNANANGRIGFLCWIQENKDLHAIPINVPVKKIPDEDGTYEVRVYDEDDVEDISEFSTVEKNWGESTNQAISHWKIEYCDGWLGYRGVYAWKKKE